MLNKILSLALKKVVGRCKGLHITEPQKVRSGFEEEHGQALGESCLAKFPAVVKAEFIQVFHTHL